MKLRFTRLLAATIALSAFADARADVPGAPDVKAIIEKSIAAAGGKEKLESIKTLALDGTVRVPAANIEGTFSMKKKTDRALMQIELGQLGAIRIGWNNDVIYEQSDLTGTRLITGPERDQFLRDLDPRQQFSRLATLKDLRVDGAEAINGINTWRLIGKSESGADETHWIDQKSYQSIRIAMVVDTQMGKIKVVSTMKDYKDIDGFPIPMTVEQEAAGSMMVLTFKDVRINPDLPDAQFELPEEVKKLVARQSTTQPALP